MPESPVTTQHQPDILARTLLINEIFFSLQGETSKVGLPTAFIRLTGCPLRCQYCDTSYAFHEGQKISLAKIVQTISTFRTRHVTVTGGEPLAQKVCLDLLNYLCDEAYQVSLETSGAIDLAGVDTRVVKILDIKTPGSRQAAKNKFDNLEYITAQDQIKFVICDRTDYQWSIQIIKQYQLTDRCEVYFSPSHDELQAVTLADWILQDKLPVRFQVQLHKYLWGDVPGK